MCTYLTCADASVGREECGVPVPKMNCQGAGDPCSEDGLSGGGEGLLVPKMGCGRDVLRCSGNGLPESGGGPCSEKARSGRGGASLF